MLCVYIVKSAKAAVLKGVVKHITFRENNLILYLRLLFPFSIFVLL